VTIGYGYVRNVGICLVTKNSGMMKQKVLGGTIANLTLAEKGNDVKVTLRFMFLGQYRKDKMMELREQINGKPQVKWHERARIALASRLVGKRLWDYMLDWYYNLRLKNDPELSQALKLMDMIPDGKCCSNCPLVDYDDMGSDEWCRCDEWCRYAEWYDSINCEKLQRVADGLLKDPNCPKPYKGETE